MPALAILLALTLAFPREGMELPPVAHTYVIGAVDAPAAGLTVGGTAVTPHPSGAFAAYVAVTQGVNVITAAAGDELATVRFTVSPPPDSAAPATPPKVYAPLEYAKAAPRALTPAELEHPLVVLDPGHGGDEDTGAVSPHGRFEKDANLALALALGEALAERGFTVRYTREDDRALKLYERPRAAHELGAVAFVSVHHNAPAVDRSALTRYAAVYSWNPLGEALAAAIAAATGWRTEHANFAVTRSGEIPSCLLEADFITSPDGEADIFDPARRRAVAAQVAAGIAAYVAKRREELPAAGKGEDDDDGN